MSIPFQEFGYIKGFLASKFGGRILYGCGVLFTGILTLLTPPASRLGIGMLIAVRFFEGLFEVSF